MGTTINPPLPVYDSAWLVPMMQELQLRDPRGRAVTPAPAIVPNRPRLPPAPGGKGDTRLPLAGMMREALMGTGRRGIKAGVAADIAEMQVDGLAAPITLAGQNGRQLKGNFFTAEGYNLKDTANNNRPDLSRPVVLLLTGSGGSAQDQGLDMSKAYAKKGASVLSVNYGGFGDSTAPNGGDNKPTEESMYQDAQTMLQHLVDLGYDPENIIIHGYSLGGAIGGKLKEEMEAGTMTPSDGSAPVPIKFRGQVMDRPMVSLAHGVKAHGFSKPIQAYARKALGTFSARRAMADSTNRDTRVVVTDDTTMGTEPDALRTKLKSQPGRAAVTGLPTNAVHENSAAMINSNGAALDDLIQNRRDGSAQVVASGQPLTNYDTSTAMSAAITSEVSRVMRWQTAAAQEAAKLSTITTVNATALERWIGDASRFLGMALDISRNILPLYAVDKANAEAAAAGLQVSLATLVGLRSRTPAPQMPADGTPPPAPPVVPPELVDATSVRARRLLTELAQAGGPSLANQDREKAVLEQGRQISGLGETFFDATLVADLATARTAIQARRDQAQRDAQERQKRRRAAMVNGRLRGN